MGWCGCISGEAPRARPVACAGNGVGCVTGEAGAGAVVGGAACRHRNYLSCTPTKIPVCQNCRKTVIQEQKACFDCLIIFYLLYKHTETRFNQAKREKNQGDIRESLLHQCVHAPTRFRVNQVPSLLDLLFVKFPNLTSPITIQPPLGKSDYAPLQCTYTSAVPQPPPLPSKVNPARINVQTLTSLALECNWEFPEKSSLNDLWISFRDQISLLTSNATQPLKTRKHSLNKPYYTRRVKRAIQRRREAWTTVRLLTHVTANRHILFSTHSKPTCPTNFKPILLV